MVNVCHLLTGQKELRNKNSVGKHGGFKKILEFTFIYIYICVEYNALPCISSKLIYIYNSVLYSVCVMYLKIYRYHMFKQ